MALYHSEKIGGGTEYHVGDRYYIHKNYERNSSIDPLLASYRSDGKFFIYLQFDKPVGKDVTGLKLVNTRTTSQKYYLGGDNYLWSGGELLWTYVDAFLLSYRGGVLNGTASDGIPSSNKSGICYINRPYNITDRNWDVYIEFI